MTTIMRVYALFGPVTAQSLCGVVCASAIVACNFPRPADVGGDAGSNADGGVDGGGGGGDGGAADGGGADGGVPRCNQVGYPSLPWPATGPSLQVAAPDVNNDGKPDLIVTHQLSLSVLLGIGDGTFQAKVDYPVGLMPASIAVADLNNDGKLDIVTANASVNTLSVLLGNGDGSFQPKVDIS
ncbi:MAG TPA: VCBS repeat-containing protein, partial [Kofleriaceae bacterium]|nr:VCBS repeat-containing protein [Kofleriaceae bacterium]